MKRWLLRALYLCGALVALLSIAGLIARSMITGSSKDSVVAALSRRLGVAVSVGEVQFDLASIFQLKPAISLNDIAIGNPPGYRAKSLLTAKRISAQIALAPLFSRRIEMQSILIDTPQIVVESDAHGGTNIEAFLKKLSSPAPLPSGSQPAAGSSPAASPQSGGQGADSGATPALGIDDFRVSGGEVLIAAADSGAPPLRIGAINLRVQDLSAGSNCRLDLSAKLFGGPDSGFHLEGHAGPFVSQVLPLDAKLTLTIVPHEIPERIRREQFGVLLGAPGDKAKATLEVSLKGDLYNNVAGPAKLTLSGLKIGKDAGHLIQMDGDAPALFSAQKPMSTPAFHLQVLNARLKLGAGEWAGAADLHTHGATVSAASRGSIHNVDVNELLGSLTADGGGKIYGIIDVPTYTLQVAGKTADEMKNSLEGTAKLSVTKGRIAMLDMLSSIQQALGSAQSAGAGTAGSTAFTSLTSDLSVKQARLDLSAIAFDSPVLKFTGNGTIGFDHSLHFDLSASVSGAVANLVNQLTRQASSSGQTTLPVTITGTVDHPQVHPSVSKLATGAVKGLVQSLFNRQK